MLCPGRGAGGALARRPGGGGGGAEELCFMPGLLVVMGRERSGNEGLCVRGSSGREARPLSASSWGRPPAVDTGGLGAAARELGACRAGFPARFSAGSLAPTGRSFGTPPWKSPPLGCRAPAPEPYPPPLPLGFSMMGALRSLMLVTFFSLVPLQMSCKRAPRPRCSSRLSLICSVLP